MSHRDLQREPELRRSLAPGHSRTPDDVDLPPIYGDGDSAVPPHDAGLPVVGGQHGRPRSLGSRLGLMVLVGALGACGWALLGPASAERQNPQWAHVAAATDASATGANQFVQVDDSGATQVAPAVEAGDKDVARNATRKLRTALRRNGLTAATALLQGAQGLPRAAMDPDVTPPMIAVDSKWAAEVKNGNRQLYEIDLFDCCDEDGDVVEIIVNGESFATFPIRHRGTRVAIPLAAGENLVEVKSVKDGGGGVTLAFRTSRGDFYARSMRVGEIYPMRVVVR